jgi:hypothetical protein
MEHYAAIDVSLEWSSVCVVDASGQIVREARVRSEREALVGFFAASGPPADADRPPTGGRLPMSCQRRPRGQLAAAPAASRA